MDPASDDEKHQQQHQQQREDEGGELRGAAVAPDPTSNGPTPSSSSTSESSQTEQEQNASQQELSSSPTAPPNAADENMDVARRFLADDNVRNATRAQKVRFLRSKGLRDEHIEKLLSESERRSRASSQDRKPDSDEDSPPSLTPSPAAALQANPETRADRPPIVTYPEFLARPPRPPPLVTPNTLINTLYALTGVSALVYGASAWVVEPMVDTLNESRQDFYATTSRNLDALVSKLEGAVSEIPPAARRRPDSKGGNSKGGYTDESLGEYDDPTELFHRDIGTQTIAQPSTRATSPSSSVGGRNAPILGRARAVVSDEPVSHRHARQLARLATTVSSLRDDLVAQAEDLADCKASIDVFNDELEKLAAQSNIGSPTSYFTGRTDFFYGSAELNKKPHEPDDEIKKVRESIRRLKGTLLSARNFPISAASVR